MIRPSLLVAALLALAPAASAAERSVGIGSFDRLRVDGPFVVTVTTGRSPGATIGGDRDTIDDVEVRSDGGTVSVRRMPGGRWGERPAAVASRPVTVALTTPALSAVSLVGAAKVSVTRMAASRIDVAVAGSGSVAVGAIAADDVRAQLIGTGSLTLAGSAAAVRLTSNGAGTIDAAGLRANDLVIGADGQGAILAQARYTARVASGGLGPITVTGSPKCLVKADAAAPITCGAVAR